MKEHDFIERLNLTENEQVRAKARNFKDAKWQLEGLVCYLLRATAHGGDRTGQVDIYVNKEREPDGYFYMGTCSAGEGDEQTATWVGRYELPK